MGAEVLSLFCQLATSAASQEEAKGLKQAAVNHHRSFPLHYRGLGGGVFFAHCGCEKSQTWNSEVCLETSCSPLFHAAAAPQDVENYVSLTLKLKVLNKGEEN